MRTLLNEILPPQCLDERIISPPGAAGQALRNFPHNAGLTTSDDLAEVGLGKTVMVTPSADAEKAKPALERGVAISGASILDPEV